MKIGVVFYSKTGNTKKVAEKIKTQAEKQNHSVDVVEIIPEKQPGFLKAVYSAIRQKTLSVTNKNLDVSSYDFVFVGCPVWAKKPAPFVKTILQKSSGFDDVKAAVFVSCGGSEESDSKAAGIVKPYLEKKKADVVDDFLIVHMTRKGEIKKEIPSIKEFVSQALDIT